MHCPGGNATGLIWRVLASSDGISSWTPLKPQQSNPNPSPRANQLWCIDFLTPPTPLIIPHRHPAFLESLMPLKNWCLMHARCSKSSLKHSIRFCGIIFSKFKTQFYGIFFLKYPHVLIAFLKFTRFDNQAFVGFWRCPWCNGYRRRIWTRRHEFKSWTWLIAFHIGLIPLGKVWIQIFSLQLWVNSRAD